jgi:hypothetical protein
MQLAARGESTIGRVLGAAGVDARRRDAGDAGTSSRSANAADAPAPPEPFGRIGIAGNLCVACRQRCPRIASSSRLDLARNTYARDLLYFHHGLLAQAAARLRVPKHQSRGPFITSASCWARSEEAVFFFREYSNACLIHLRETQMRLMRKEFLKTGI